MPAWSLRADDEIPAPPPRGSHRRQPGDLLARSDTASTHHRVAASRPVFSPPPAGVTATRPALPPTAATNDEDALPVTYATNGHDNGRIVVREGAGRGAGSGAGGVGRTGAAVRVARGGRWVGALRVDGRAGAARVRAAVGAGTSRQTARRARGRSTTNRGRCGSCCMTPRQVRMVISARCCSSSRPAHGARSRTRSSFHPVPRQANSLRLFTIFVRLFYVWPQRIYSVMTLLLGEAAENSADIKTVVLACLPSVLFLVILGFVFFRMLSRSRKLMKTIDHPSMEVHHHGFLAKLYFRAVGLHSANTVGRIARYHQRHRAFLSSGSVCPQCGRTLLNRSWMPLVRCLDSDGNPVRLIAASAKGAYFACPFCDCRWPFRQQV